MEAVEAGAGGDGKLLVVEGDKVGMRPANSREVHGDDMWGGGGRWRGRVGGDAAPCLVPRVRLEGGLEVRRVGVGASDDSTAYFREPSERQGSNRLLTLVDVQHKKQRETYQPVP